MVAGIPKSGKTTLFANFVEKYFGDVSKGLLLAFEPGYGALRVNAVDINSWREYEDIVDQLIEYKDEVPYKILGIDTADLQYALAQERVIQEWNISNPKKRTSDISGVGAKGNSDQGYGVGYALAREKVRSSLNKLMWAGYGIMAITHSKDKEIEEKSGLKYDQLVSSLPNSAREIYVNAADFIVFLTAEKEQVGGKLGGIETKRYMYFRGDGYVEAGGRFKNVPIRIEYDVDEFIETIKNAIQAEYSDDANLDEIRGRQTEERDAAAEKFLAEEANKVPTAEESISEIDNLVAEMTLTTELREKLSAIFEEEIGIRNYKLCTDADQLHKCVQRIKEI